MVHSRELKKVNSLLEEKFSLEQSKLVVDGLDEISSSNFDKTEFENNLNEIKFFTSNKNSKVKISGSGIVVINVISDSELYILFEGTDLSMVSLRINVLGGVKLKLIDVNDNVNLFREVSVELGENSIVDYKQFIFNTRYNIITSNLRYNSKYNLNSIFKGDSSEIFLINNSINKDSGCYSNMSIKGISMNGARVISEGNVRIEKEAINSEGYQKIQGLIIDNESKIFSEPRLEIENNQVKCSHGASIHQVSDSVQFYMMSRGVSKENIVKIITDGFFNEILTDLDEEYSNLVLGKAGIIV